MDAKLLNTLRYELERFVGAAPEEVDARLAKLLRLTETLRREPTDASDAPIKRYVIELDAALADGRLPPSYPSLLQELARVLQERKQPAAPAPTDVLQEARKLVAGRALLVIGGLTRPDHQEALREALGLSEVLWPSTRESNPRLDPFEPLIARPDVVAVVLLIRWIRHAMNDAAALCLKHGKVMVRVPSGYNVNQIAQLLVEQSRRRADE